jgi:hypothetical protein
VGQNAPLLVKNNQNRLKSNGHQFIASAYNGNDNDGYKRDDEGVSGMVR